MLAASGIGKVQLATTVLKNVPKGSSILGVMKSPDGPSVTALEAKLYDTKDPSPVLDKAQKVYPYGERTYWDATVGKVVTDFHRGVDYSGLPEGSPIISPWEGIVISVVNKYLPDYRTSSSGMESYGNYVEILTVDNNGDEVIYRMAHMYCVKVEVGQTVYKSTIIGAIGSAGHSTGAHLHMDVHYPNQNRHDPDRGMEIDYQ